MEMHQEVKAEMEVQKEGRDGRKGAERRGCER